MHKQKPRSEISILLSLIEASSQKHRLESLPHSLMSWQRGAPLGHRRTPTQTLTWRGGSHWLLAVTGAD